MIEKATAAFWDRLAGLAFVDLVQVQRWRGVAAEPGATWLQLCQTIQTESALTAGHLQLLAQGIERPPVAIGSNLVLRPAFHALGWEAYEARHVKLQQNLRLVLLPAGPTGGESPGDPPVLDRVRDLAAAQVMGVAQIRDVEWFAGRYVVSMTPTDGRRLSQVWAFSPKPTVSTEIELAQHLVRLLTNLTGAGLQVPRLDPLLLTLSETGQALTWDDPISSDWLEDDFFPPDLAAEEAAVVVEYRARRVRYLEADRSTGGGPWQECAAALDFMASRVEGCGGDGVQVSEGVQRLRGAAARLMQSANASDSEISAWLAEWLLGGDETPAWVVGGSSNQHDEGVKPLPAGGKSSDRPISSAASRGIAARQAAKREQQRRQRVVTALAVAAPFPICLFLFLLGYFLWPTGDRLPDVSNQRGQSELPVSELPVSELPDLGVVDSVALKPGRGGRAADQDLLADLLPVPTVDDRLEALADVPQVDLVSSLLDMAGDEPVPTESDGALSAGFGIEVNDHADPAVAETVVVRGWVVAEPPAEDGFVSFGAVSARVDWLGAWRAAHGSVVASWSDDNRPAGPIYLVSVGRVNSTTARHMRIQLVGETSGPWTLQTIGPEVALASGVIQAWDLGYTRAGTETSIARVQTTVDGHLELRFLAGAVAALPTDASLKLELHDKNRTLTHELDLSQGERPRLPQGTDVGLANGDGLPAATSSRSGAEALVAADETLVDVGVGGTAADAGSDNGEITGEITGSEIPNLSMDPRTGSIKSWGQEWEGDAAEPLTWHFQVGGRSFKPVDKENPTWQSLKVRGKEDPYISDELLDAGSLVLTAVTDEGNRVRVQARLYLLTPTGLRPLKKSTAAEASSEAGVLLQRLRAQHYAVKTPRARPGEGDRKQAELNRLEALIKELERYQQVVETVAGDAEQIFAQGVAFGVSRRVGEENVWLWKSAGFQQP